MAQTPKQIEEQVSDSWGISIGCRGYFGTRKRKTPPACAVRGLVGHMRLLQRSDASVELSTLNQPQSWPGGLLERRFRSIYHCVSLDALVRRRETFGYSSNGMPVCIEILGGCSTTFECRNFFQEGLGYTFPGANLFGRAARMVVTELAVQVFIALAKFTNFNGVRIGLRHGQTPFRLVIERFDSLFFGLHFCHLLSGIRRLDQAFVHVV